MTTHILDTPKPQSNILKRSWAIVRDDWRAYITINVLYYGIVVLGMLYVAFVNRGLQESLLEAIGAAFTSGPLAAVGGAYSGGKVFQATGLTFLVNFFLGSLLEINVPSFIVPFVGLLMGLYRAVLWGLLLSPTTPSLAGAMIPHSLVLVLEGQAYIMAMLAVFVHGKAFLKPEAYGIQGHGRGYVEGLRRTAWIYVLVALLLAIAAMYEAVEVIYLAPLFV